MNIHVVRVPPFRVNLDQLSTKLRLKPGSPHVDAVRYLSEEAQALAAPKGAYREAFVEHGSDSHVLVDGERLTSRVLAVNLDQVYRVFPYVATCGTELEGWYRTQPDLLRQFWAEAIAEMALRWAVVSLRAQIRKAHAVGQLSSMSPGSLQDWPLEQQEQIFRLLQGGADRIGVRLTESMLMVPIKSLSGLFFSSETTFVSCQLCSRADCPRRRAEFEPGLYQRRYEPKKL